MDLHIFLCIFILFPAVKGQNNWPKPGFIKNEEETSRVNFIKSDNDKEQIIEIEENIEEEITIAFLNYKGSDTPTIEKFTEPSSTANNLLGAVFKRTGNNENWGLVITKPQDADDKEDNFRYGFDVAAAEEIRRVYIEIINIDDEKPFIQAHTTPCKIEENTPGLSDCIYTIIDADGIMNNYVKYTLSGIDGIEKTFAIKNNQELQNKLKQWDTTLEVLQSLDYERIASYVFDFTVEDSGGNTGVTKIVVEVIDLPDEPPVWRKIFSSQQYPEKQQREFEVEAADGDVGINAPINYELISDYDFFTIDKITGKIIAKPIDRDALEKEIFTFQVRAYEEQDPTSEIIQGITIIIEDINDNYPEITVTPESIEIPESTYTTLKFDITIHDKDVGDFASYEVFLEDDKYNKAFQIVPNRAYQKWTFSISVADSALLDYEEPDWREISLIIRSRELFDTTHEDTKTVKVILQNWNDEVPIFEIPENVVKVPEDIKKGEEVAVMYAKDRDVGDTVTHSLIGRAINEMFGINDQGVITTKIDNAFDYEKQQVVIIQVQAEDTLGEPFHKTIAQLTVEVIDVNDEPPRILVPSQPISIKENQKHGTVINSNIDITATDEDTEAHLEFSINWEDSYATKNGQLVSKDLYKECVEVDTNLISGGEAKAILKVSAIEDEGTPDYEKYDTLYLILIVKDTAQTILPNTDNVRVTINIEDVNDCKPEFDMKTITSKKTVIEHAIEETNIGTIVATDDDGPEFNKITYSLSPFDEKTPEGLVDIDEITGELFVKGDIDADIPIYNLIYLVSAKDQDFETKEKITIEVIDTNDKEPKINVKLFKKIVHIDEKSSDGVEVQTIVVEDDDRDEPYKTPWFQFSSFAQDIKDYFSIDSISGKVYVQYKDPDKKLDRDKGPVSHTIPFIVGDNRDGVGPGSRQNKVEDVFTVILDDINDQIPTILTEALETTENLEKGRIIGIVEAKDDDDPNLPNSKIAFTLISITKGKESGADPPEDLFIINVEKVANGVCQLIANYDLEGYFGTYEVIMKVNDLGIPTQESRSSIDININKYNFKEPKFLFPEDEDPLYLSKNQRLEQTLQKFDGSLLEHFSATDSQNEKWNLKFKIDPDSDPNNVFRMVSAGRSEGELQLINQPNYENIYKLKIIADCECTGNAQPTNSITIHIRFINKNTEPYFEDNEEKYKFPENESGLSIVKVIPKAYFNKHGEDWDIYKIYYFLTKDDSKKFDLGKESRELTLIEELDREELPNFVLTIVASQNEKGNSEPDDKSILYIDIEVTDINDNFPNFEQKMYFSGVKSIDDLNKNILQIYATDLDFQDSLDIKIVPNSLKAEGEGIKNIPEPFIIRTENEKVKFNGVDGTRAKGNIHLNFAVLTNMNGYFTFDVEVTDEENQKDSASIKIYVVSETSRTIFKFENDLDTVIPKQNNIKHILEEELGYLCNIESIQKATNEEGVQIETVTDVLMHYVDTETNEPISSETIIQKVSTFETFSRLKTEFLKEGLYLLSFNEKQTEQNMEEVLRAWLIGVTVVLGSLCIILIIAFIIKTRSLMTRLNKLSTTQFGSQESGLNRMGVAVPNTNKHAIEGSNPIYNNEKKLTEPDAASIGSGDSDLIGIEDNPNFGYRTDNIQNEYNNNMNKYDKLKY